MYQRLGLGLPLLSVLLLARCGGSTPLLSDQPDTTLVATFGDEHLRMEDFAREYTRNSSLKLSGVEDSPEEFLDRYVNFRLKVFAAEDAGYHQDPGILGEIHSYRAAFARPYLVDREVLAPILLDYYEKKKQLVHASQIFFRLSPEMGSADTLRIFRRAEAIRDSVLQGMPFDVAAVRFSEDPAATTASARQGYRGDLGWFTAGMMIKAFEDRAYSESIGRVSEVFRSDYGYHLILVHDRKPSVPNIRLSQILVRISGTSPESLAVARQKIDQAKARLDVGQNFALVAGEMSEEEKSRSRGGDIGVITYLTRGIDTTFKRIAFNIGEVGDVTDVVQTGYGFQILKLTGRNTLGTYEEEYESLKRESRGLPRMVKAESALAHDARSRYRASLDTLALTSLVSQVELDSVRAYFSMIAADDSLGSIVIGQVADSVYTVRQLGRFTADRNNRIPNAQSPPEQAIIVGNAFLDYAAITHTALDLEKKDEEFAWIMKNFRDGLLLFRLMEDSVWTAASEDSTALAAHYEANKDRYRFKDRHRIMEVFGYNAATHEEAILQLDQGMSWTDFYDYIQKDSVMTVRFDTVLVEGTTRSVYDRALGLSPGKRSEVFTYRNGFLALFYDGIEPASPKSFQEARAEVLNEYQTLLEENLLARLRERYQAVTYPARARQAVDEQ